MKYYENLVVVKPTLTEEEIVAQIDAIKENITKNGGEIVAVNDMGMKKLAYVIEKQKRGYYTVIYFKAEPAIIGEIERLERINENLLKFLTIKYESNREVKAVEAMIAKLSSANKEENAQ